MKQIWTIAIREFRAFFDSLIAYFLIIIFLGLTGVFTWLPVFNSDVFFSQQASMQPFFAISYWAMFFFIPALSMRMLAEENKTGTLELLLTKDVTDWQVVLGKFLAVMLLVIVALLFSLPFYFTIAWLGPIDHGAVICGYLGIILMSAAYAGIGIFASSITSNQIVAFLLALLIGLLFLMIFGGLATSVGGTLGKVFNYMSISTHYESMSRGVLDTRDIFYFLSIAGLGLLMAETVLSKRKATN